MEKEGILNKTIVHLSEKEEGIQTIIIAILAFLVPTFLGMLISRIFGASSTITLNTQIIVGSLVNTMLVISAINLKGFNKLAIITTMPSISAIFGGFVLKTSAVFTMYMIPAIWVGNFILIFGFKYLYIHKGLHFLVTGIIGIIAKVLVIFGFFYLLKTLNVFPLKAIANLQTSMGITQLITATIGVIVAFFSCKIEKNNEINKNLWGMYERRF